MTHKKYPIPKQPEEMPWWIELPASIFLMAVILGFFYAIPVIEWLAIAAGQK